MNYTNLARSLVRYPHQEKWKVESDNEETRGLPLSSVQSFREGESEKAGK